MLSLWDNGELSVCSLIEKFKKIANKEAEASNLDLLCSLAYYIWIDRNIIVFHKAKPQNALSIIRQVISSITMDSHIIEP